MRLFIGTGHPIRTFGHFFFIRYSLHHVHQAVLSLVLYIHSMFKIDSMYYFENFIFEDEKNINNDAAENGKITALSLSNFYWYLTKTLAHKRVCILSLLSLYLWVFHFLLILSAVYLSIFLHLHLYLFLFLFNPAVFRQ